MKTKIFYLTIILTLISFKISYSQDDKDLQSKLKNYYYLKLYKQDSAICVLLENCYKLISDRTDKGQSPEITTLTQYITIAEDYLAEYPLDTAKYNDQYLFIHISVELGIRETGLPNVYAFRAELKFKKEDYNGAFEDYKSSIESHAEAQKSTFNELISINYYNMGICKINLNDKVNACIYLSKAGELGYEKAFETIKVICNK